MPPKRNLPSTSTTPSTPPRPSSSTSPPTQKGPSTHTSTTAGPPGQSKLSSTNTAPSVSSSSSLSSAPEIVQTLLQNYNARTSARVKLLDAFLAYLVVSGILQFLYCVLAGNYPFNAFLSGFAAAVGQFVLTVSLRIQTNPENKTEFKSIGNERAFADYVVGSLLLHFFCVNFIN